MFDLFRESVDFGSFALLGMLSKELILDHFAKSLNTFGSKLGRQVARERTFSVSHCFTMHKVWWKLHLRLCPVGMASKKYCSYRAESTYCCCCCCKDSIITMWLHMEFNVFLLARPVFKGPFLNLQQGILPFLSRFGHHPVVRWRCVHPHAWGWCNRPCVTSYRWNYEQVKVIGWDGGCDQKIVATDRWILYCWCFCGLWLWSCQTLSSSQIAQSQETTWLQTKPKASGWKFE